MADLMAGFANVPLWYWISLLVGLALSALGSLLNFIVVKTNGGKMPVVTHDPIFMSAIWTDPKRRHIWYLEKDAKLLFLSDFIKFRGFIYSPGDILMDCGVVIPITALVAGIIQLVIQLV